MSWRFDRPDFPDLETQSGCRASGPDGRSFSPPEESPLTVVRHVALRMRPAVYARGAYRESSSSSPLDGGALAFEMPGTSPVTDAPSAEDLGEHRRLAAWPSSWVEGRSWLAAEVRWQVIRTFHPRSPAARQPPGRDLLPARDGRLCCQRPSAGA